MPAIFEDIANDYDLTIGDVDAWAITTAGLPNGDNYATRDDETNTSLVLNDIGDDFDFGDGTAWTFEFWFKFTGTAVAAQVFFANGVPATTTMAWQVAIGSDERVTFILFNTSGGNYMTLTTAVLGGGTWHHVVLRKNTGAQMTSVINDVADASTTTTTGTVRTPDSTYKLYLATNPNSSFLLWPYVDIAKVAIYNTYLSTDQIHDHYLAMTT